MILFVGIITGAPRGPDTPKELKEGGAEHFKLKEGEANMAGERAINLFHFNEAHFQAFSKAALTQANCCRYAKD